MFKIGKNGNKKGFKKDSKESRIELRIYNTKTVTSTSTRLTKRFKWMMGVTWLSESRDHTTMTNLGHRWGGFALV